MPPLQSRSSRGRTTARTRKMILPSLNELIRPPRTVVLTSAAVGVATLALARRAGPTPLPWVTAGLAAAHAMDAEHFVRVLVQVVVIVAAAAQQQQQQQQQ